MICPSCATAADLDAFEAVTTGISHGHAPADCRDAAIAPHGCTCQHKPAGTATTQETSR